MNQTIENQTISLKTDLEPLNHQIQVGGKESSEIDYNDEELRFIDYGSLGYDIDAIAKIEGQYPQVIEDRMNLHPSLKLLYEKSVAQSKYTMDLKIFNLAMAGDIKAIEMHKDRLIRDKLNNNRTY